MAVSDVEVWVDSNGDQTCDLKLTRPWGVTYNRRKHLDGEASFVGRDDERDDLLRAMRASMSSAYAVSASRAVTMVPLRAARTSARNDR